MSIEVDMDLLIELIQQYPVLYDVKDKNSKNNDLKEKCWEVVSMQVDVSVDDCKRLWRNLRDRFNKEKRLHPVGSEVPESTWPYFSKMFFYSKYSMPRKTVVATSRHSTERPGSSSSDSHLWGGLDLIPPEGVSGTKEEDEFASSISQGQQNCSYSSPKSWAFEASEPTSKRIKQERSLHEYEEVTTPPVVGNTLGNTQVSKNDVNDNFGAYVVSRLKEMNPEVAKQKRKKMLLILEEDE